jgi:hypothetical protein
MEIQETRKPLAVLIGGKAVAIRIEYTSGVLHAARTVGSVKELAIAHDAFIAVLAEVVNEERPFGSDQALDGLDEEFVSERRLESAGSNLETFVVVKVEEDVKRLECIEALREREELTDFLGNVTVRHPPLSWNAKAVIHGTLVTLRVAPEIELGQVVRLHDVLFVVGGDFEAWSELHVTGPVIEGRWQVKPRRNWRDRRERVAGNTYSPRGAAGLASSSSHVLTHTAPRSPASSSRSRRSHARPSRRRARHLVLKLVHYRFELLDARLELRFARTRNSRDRGASLAVVSSAAGGLPYRTARASAPAAAAVYLR